MCTWVVCVAAALLPWAQGLRGAAPWAGWAAEAQRQIERDFKMADRPLYADEQKRGGPPAVRPAWNWGAGVQLTALVAAAKHDPDAYRAPLRAFLEGLRQYWVTWRGIASFAVEPNPNSTDRYYDDNAWMGLALADAYEVLGDRSLLAWAEDTAAFVFSGEDETLGGGIYWREREKLSKNTCSNAPAVVLALRLHGLTGRPDYRERALRLYRWTNTHLQDTDGLYWDNVALNGRIGDHKWTYNTALMLRANVILSRGPDGAPYLDEARRLAKAALRHWVDPATGAIKDDGAFAHLLTEALLELHGADPTGPWLATVEQALVFVHDRVRDPEGRYPKHWHRPVGDALETYALIDQASVARAYWMLAGQAKGKG